MEWLRMMSGSGPRKSVLSARNFSRSAWSSAAVLSFMVFSRVIDAGTRPLFGGGAKCPTGFDQIGGGPRRHDRRSHDQGTFGEGTFIVQTGRQRPVMSDEMALTFADGWRCFNGAAVQFERLELHGRLFDVRTNPQRIDPDPRLRGLAAFPKALAVTLIELIHQHQHVALISQAGQFRHDRRLHALVAVAHVKFEPVANLVQGHPLANQILASAALEFFN